MTHLHKRPSDFVVFKGDLDYFSCRTVDSRSTIETILKQDKHTFYYFIYKPLVFISDQSTSRSRKTEG